MLTLHLPDGTLRVTMAAAVAPDLSQQLDRLKQSWRQPVPPPRPEWQFVYQDGVQVEFFCNPNVWPTPFAAQVLVTVRHPDIHVSTQISLPQLLADVNAWVTMDT